MKKKVTFNIELLPVELVELEVSTAEGKILASKYRRMMKGCLLKHLQFHKFWQNI